METVLQVLRMLDVDSKLRVSCVICFFIIIDMGERKGSFVVPWLFNAYMGGVKKKVLNEDGGIFSENRDCHPLDISQY